MTSLDDMFTEARLAGPAPSDALSARVMADAMAAQPRALPLRAAPTPGLLDRLFGLFGGAGPVAGGVLAGIAGLAIGYLQPEGLASLTDTLLASSTTSVSMDLMPGFDTLMTEE